MIRGYILYGLALVLIVTLTACTQQDTIARDKPESGAMPLQNEDVLWVSSVPLGADVFVISDIESYKSNNKSNDPNAPSHDAPYMSTHTIESTAIQHEKGIFSQPAVGKTPMALNVPDGNLIIGVQLNVNDQNIAWELFNQANKAELSEDEFFAEMWTNVEIYDGLPNGEIGHSGNGTKYLNDGNQELWAIITDGIIRKIGKTYKVKKEPGKAATVIALFQREDDDPEELYKTLPEDYKLRTRTMLSAPIWEVTGVPKANCKNFHKRMIRGGKAIYIGTKKQVMCEFVPLDHAVPNKRTTGGFTMRMVGGFDD